MEDLLPYLLHLLKLKHWLYEWIKSCPKVNDRTYYSVYSGLEDYDYDNVQEIEEEKIANQGIYNTDYAEDFCLDLYYGATLDYWELVKEDVDMGLVERMIAIGIDIVIV